MILDLQIFWSILHDVKLIIAPDTPVLIRIIVTLILHKVTFHWFVLSYRSVDKKFNVNFVRAQTVNQQSKDVVTVAGVTVPDQDIGEVTNTWGDNLMFSV